MKHSPGPWRTSPTYGHECVVDARKRMVADGAIFHTNRGAEENRANASVCAEAPNMLALLKRIRKEEVLEPECEREIDAVLAKAERQGLVR